MSRAAVLTRHIYVCPAMARAPRGVGVAWQAHGNGMMAISNVHPLPSRFAADDTRVWDQRWACGEAEHIPENQRTPPAGWEAVAREAVVAAGV